jgi:RNA polymerase sigma-70 factor, ECF subfamily
MAVDDRARFEAIFRAHVGAVRAYARRRSDPATAEDVVADTFLVCWRRLDDVPGDPLPWLYGVARRALANRRRAARRAESAIERFGGERVAAPPGPAERAERRGDVAGILTAMAGLGERDREVLRLDAWEGLAAADAARAAGCSVTAYRVRLHRARRRLAARLEAGDAPSCLPLRPQEDRS